MLRFGETYVINRVAEAYLEALSVVNLCERVFDAIDKVVAHNHRADAWIG